MLMTLPIKPILLLLLYSAIAMVLKSSAKQSSSVVYRYCWAHLSTHFHILEILNRNMNTVLSIQNQPKMRRLLNNLVTEQENCHRNCTKCPFVKKSF